MNNLLEEIAKYVIEAGKILTNANYDELDISNKEGNNNFVTKYDKNIQIYLKENLLKLVQGSKFYGEEMDDECSLDAEYIFVVDPIDGTNNFTRRLNESAISVGLLHKGKPFIGVCYNPFVNELFYAVKGKGAYLNGKPIHVSNRDIENGIVFTGGSPYYTELRDKMINMQINSLNTAGEFRRFGSAVIELCYVAAGKAEVYYEHKLQLWDYAAACLILTEAGGILKTLDNEDVKYTGPSSVIAANNIDNLNKIIIGNQK